MKKLIIILSFLLTSCITFQSDDIEKYKGWILINDIDCACNPVDMSWYVSVYNPSTNEVERIRIDRKYAYFLAKGDTIKELKYLKLR